MRTRRPEGLWSGGRVEDGRGGLGHVATPRFPSPLVKPDVRITRIRLPDWLHREAQWPKVHASKAQHAERSEDLIVGEPLCAAPLHLVPLAQERANTIADVVVDRPVGRQSRSVAEVS